MNAFKIAALCLASASALLAGPLVAPAAAQAPLKPRLAIRTIEATPAVAQQAERSGQAAALRQILQAASPLLTTAISRSGRFDVVAREDLAEVLREQDLGESGLVDPSDPQRARPGRLAAAGFVATVTLDNFQDITQRTAFSGQFGESAAERRTIQLQATLKIFDTTTGVLAEPATITLELSALDEILPGVAQEGRSTNALVGEIARSFAIESANEILNRLAPARVVGYTLGTATINRGEGTGIEVGQFWEIFHAGEAMVDPDTGEDLGAEEIPVGWAKVVSVGGRTSRLQVIEDFGVDLGSILRYRRGGPPPGVDRERSVAGSASGGAVREATPRGAGADGEPRGSAAPRGGEVSPGATGAAARGQQPLRLALFIQSAAPAFPADRVATLDSLVAAAVTVPGIEVISRDLVLNAVSGLARGGANEGTGDPEITAVQRMLSDEASAVSLARTLGADGLLVATIESLHEDIREFVDPSIGVASKVVITTLDLSWRLLDGASGASIASGLAESRDQIRESPALRRSPASLEALLKDGSQQIGPQVQRAVRRGDRLRPPGAEAAMVGVRISIELEDLSIPDIREVDGRWVVTAERVPLVPIGCSVLVDGILAGSAPGTIEMSPGPHRLRIERPGVEPVNQFLVAREGMEIRVPVRLSQEGRRRWMQEAQFLESLKDQAALRSNQQELAAAFAEFLRQSRVTIDTSRLQNLSVGGTSLWGQLLSD
jgi:curli biogenesis system outer membrane secretion channel CsgG